MATRKPMGEGLKIILAKMGEFSKPLAAFGLLFSGLSFANYHFHKMRADERLMVKQMELLLKVIASVKEARRNDLEVIRAEMHAQFQIAKQESMHQLMVYCFSEEFEKARI